MTKKPVSIVIVEEADGRYMVKTFAHGEVIRHLIDPTTKPRRKPRKPVSKVNTNRLDRTRKKQF